MTYGWLPQRPDHRDRPYRPYVSAAGPLPLKCSLRDSPHNGPVLRQGQIGTCVANTSADMYRFVLSAEGRPVFLPSRLYVYARGRELEHIALSEDSGMMVRDALKVAAAGVPPEQDWAYSDAKPGPFQQEPPVNLAITSHAVSYQTLIGGARAPLRSCIAEGYPFIFGFGVPRALESPAMQSGQQKLLSLPRPGERIIDGHAVQAVGYDFTRTTFPVPVFEIKNSWGEEWCEGGYFYMDYRFFSPYDAGQPPLASDIWTLRLTT